MEKPKIVVMYRVKNESRWIEKSLKSIEKICSEIVILDDGSDDDTVEICKSFKKVVKIHQQSGLVLDEVRDKNTLLKMAMELQSDYLLALDGDEVFLPNVERTIFEELEILYPDKDVFEFQFLYMWDKLNQYRYDGIYSNIWHKRLIRMKNQPRNLHFENSSYPGNLHCGSIPHNTFGLNNSVRSKVKNFHYGYYDEKLRQNNYRFYNTYDPNSELQDEYRHLISGEGKLSGPTGIEFNFIPDGIYPTNIE